MGTTTSTSSTSISSTSMSSTSSSISSTSSSTSSTSSSTSSTSTSLSTSSTSTSISSTSSSMSSTSSSTSSTSVSSTSSSTSVSSTSTSISSTSTSSTSTSSTSSSTSVSSTSSSFSSTSSSISSTSSSISSVSTSSTSSSSSTSTTTLPPPYLDYSYQDASPLPSNNSDLTGSFNSTTYAEVSADDGDYFIERGSADIIIQFKRTFPNNTGNINITWYGRSTEPFSTSPIYLQIYNNNSAAWETLGDQTVSPVDTDFTIQGSQTTNLSNYYDSTNTVAFRIYQKVI